MKRFIALLVLAASANVQATQADEDQIMTMRTGVLKVFGLVQERVTVSRNGQDYHCSEFFEKRGDRLTEAANMFKNADDAVSIIRMHNGKLNSNAIFFTYMQSGVIFAELAEDAKRLCGGQN